jgi:hypothetical protein
VNVIQKRAGTISEPAALQVMAIQEGTPTRVATALTQLVKGTQKAMHQVSLLNVENGRLRATYEKEKGKRKARHI